MLGEETVNCKLFSRKNLHFRSVIASEFASDYNKSVFLANNEGPISPFFGTVVLTNYRDFTSSKSTTETLKTLEHHVKRV